jgi:hypothetical protein
MMRAGLQAVAASEDVARSARTVHPACYHGPMMTADRYRAKAEECELMARDGDPALRAMYLAQAAQWRHLAAQAELLKVQAEKRFVVANGAPELVAAMNREDISVATAVELARLPKDDQVKCLLDEKLRHFFLRILHSDEDKAASDRSGYGGSAASVPGDDRSLSGT